MPKDLFTIIPVNYPNTILLSTRSYNLIFNATNYFNSAEKFKIDFLGEDFDVKIPNTLKKPIKIDSNQSVDVNIDITPKINGKGKLIINTIHHKKVHHTEMVWHIRKETLPIPKTMLKPIKI